MTSSDVEERIHAELASFSYAQPTSGTTVGVPWSKERMAREVETLRQALIKPRLTTVDFADSQSTQAQRSAWVVTRQDQNGYVLIFDPEANRFGLASVGPSGPPQTVAVWGDLVSTYAAR